MKYVVGGVMGWWYVSIGSPDWLAANTWQAIAEINDENFARRNMMALYHNELTGLFVIWRICHCGII